MERSTRCKLDVHNTHQKNPLQHIAFDPEEIFTVHFCVYFFIFTSAFTARIVKHATDLCASPLGSFDLSSHLSIIGLLPSQTISISYSLAKF